MVITLWPHLIVLNKDVESFRLLNTLEEKQKLISELGIDAMLILDFTLSFSANQHITLCRICSSADWGFKSGYWLQSCFWPQGQGNFQLLKEIEPQGNYKTFQVDPMQIDGVNVILQRFELPLSRGIWHWPIKC